ncbi:hypothetical protein LY78DRAFT_249182 [Colletotrichum sublineola]|nr:hypothetical protein LY78DRAFT_249182 [Colletotrichum sublineola]
MLTRQVVGCSVRGKRGLVYIALLALCSSIEWTWMGIGLRQGALQDCSKGQLGAKQASKFVGNCLPSWSSTGY